MSDMVGHICYVAIMIQKLYSHLSFWAEDEIKSGMRS